MTSSIKEIGSNIIKLEGYGMYITMIDYTLYYSRIDPSTGGPTMDPSDCIDWDVLTDPPNQEFLNITNNRFGLTQTLTDYGMIMTMKDIMSFSKARKEKAIAVGGDANANTRV